ncbi:hypothetical protein Psal071_00471 [Piscirickettsia salmonis]|uniref:Uncharacterized protein n=1 Tax=Piscirickettsia salmonis TaxID=1238 RepID=A0A9Q6LJB9_PISSA|nr:ABC transporter permease [Piscirickettsia salmonis]QGN76299.1 hypothetical protein Psal001_00477 [Piscirickettsia salmonis]QGN79862.1 hypothetical protein Psal002_00475 [Piscirickettsia salmonis]QGN83450.1 hypothetical protein Psal003_00473 [Piscirickettsia salmonis]QGN86963.1 hypothetical protein Psal004_00472 [Piscirickettsia salmonis]
MSQCIYYMMVVFFERGLLKMKCYSYFLSITQSVGAWLMLKLMARRKTEIFLPLPLLRGLDGK